MEGIKLPVRYIAEGQHIFDAENKMILEVRGWDWIQRLNKNEIGCNQSEYQNNLGEYIAKLLNENLTNSRFIQSSK